MWLGRAIAPYVHSFRSPLEWAIGYTLILAVVVYGLTRIFPRK
jgi:hypothetical protein